MTDPRRAAIVNYITQTNRSEPVSEYAEHLLAAIDAADTRWGPITWQEVRDAYMFFCEGTDGMSQMQAVFTDFLRSRRGAAPIAPGTIKETDIARLDRRGGDLETALEILDDRVLALEGRVFVLERQPK